MYLTLSYRFRDIAKFPGLCTWDDFTQSMESGRLCQGADYRAIARVLVGVCNGLSWKDRMPKVMLSFFIPDAVTHRMIRQIVVYCSVTLTGECFRAARQGKSSGPECSLSQAAQ